MNRFQILNKYIDALGEYAKDVIEQMFDSCTFDVCDLYIKNIRCWRNKGEYERCYYGRYSRSLC